MSRLGLGGAALGVILLNKRSESQAEHPRGRYAQVHRLTCPAGDESQRPGTKHTPVAAGDHDRVHATAVVFWIKCSQQRVQDMVQATTGLKGIINSGCWTESYHD